ncbi:MAG: purine nucleoside permease [Pseudomonadales bacterium]
MATPIPVKVVVVAMFESGEITGDRPGEFQFWVERLNLDTVLPFKMGEYELRMNGDGVLGICVGGGIPNATASIMALGMDSRFDLRDAYWLIAGIAGADPADMSLGSAAWARWVIDGDLLYEIDGREIPEEWPYGLIPLGAEKPQDISTGWTVSTISFELNAGLTNWAFNLTKDVKIPDSPGIREFRKQFKGFPNAQRPPFVTMGETLSSSTYWHGALMDEWANDWVKLYSNEKMNFMTSNMEDSGTMTAIHRLGRVGLVDPERVLILRTASNFTIPPPGKKAAWSATAPYADDGLPAKEAAFQIGNVVVQEILRNWPIYKDSIPGQ